MRMGRVGVNPTRFLLASLDVVATNSGLDNVRRSIQGGRNTTLSWRIREDLTRWRGTEIRKDEGLGVAMTDSHWSGNWMSNLGFLGLIKVVFVTRLVCDSYCMSRNWIACKQVDFNEDDLGLWLWELLWVMIAHCSRAFLVLGRGLIVEIACPRPTSIQRSWVFVFLDFIEWN